MPDCQCTEKQGGALEILDQKIDTSTATGKALSYYVSTNAIDNDSGNIIDTSQDLKDILLNLEPGTWKEKAQRLNDRSVFTAKGRTWPANNLRMAVKNLNDNK